ncbi:hypothetical protein P7H21_20565 [Paenibacillus larvae]|nr:hypothetical protein [Paenibacillus larvae]MDT2305847.1 hypothetical protein [Paenibacillus larvae]
MPRTWNANGAVAYSLEAFPRSWSSWGSAAPKPTYTLAAADPKKQRHFAETTFPELKKATERGD